MDLPYQSIRVANMAKPDRAMSYPESTELTVALAEMLVERLLLRSSASMTEPCPSSRSLSPILTSSHHLSSLFLHIFAILLEL